MAPGLKLYAWCSKTYHGTAHKYGRPHILQAIRERRAGKHKAPLKILTHFQRIQIKRHYYKKTLQHDLQKQSFQGFAPVDQSRAIV